MATKKTKTEDKKPKEKTFLQKTKDFFEFHFTGDKDLGKTITKEMKKNTNKKKKDSK